MHKVQNESRRSEREKHEIQEECKNNLFCIKSLPRSSVAGTGQSVWKKQYIVLLVNVLQQTS